MISRTEDWAGVARGAVEHKPGKTGKPTGETESLLHFDKQWSKIPNALIEDETGQLWLAFYLNAGEPEPGRPFEPVDVVAALTWVQNMAEFSDGHSGDIADIARIALRELQRKDPARRKPDRTG